jgi:hypothetical protein
MSAYEQEIAPVTQLQELKTNAETYEAFYRLYEESELLRKGFSVILNRVLHIDETKDRSNHLIVAQANVPMLPIRRQYGRGHAPMHYVPYSPGDMIVATTNGESITEYQTLNLHGTYRAHLNGVDQQYDPVYETVDMTLFSDITQELTLAQFNMGTGSGIVRLGGLSCGWILDDAVSAKIRQEILSPAAIEQSSGEVIAS